MWLEKYSGNWDKSTVITFLRRTTYSTSRDLIESTLAKGFDQSIEDLFSDENPVGNPIHYRFDEDPHAAIGESWVYTPPHNDIQQVKPQRRRSLHAWFLGKMLSGGPSL